MESLLHQSRAMCPFLNRTAPSALRSLATATTTTGATRPSSSPGGGTMSNLQVLARRCPVMSKALAVQGARMAGAKHQVRGLHTTAGNKASLGTGVYKKGGGGQHQGGEFS